ncbi:hypothetical protein CPB97_003544 [Podila verticillata]|nr:hypothetical protein CPB97_003544 [Podila verticillata]
MDPESALHHWHQLSKKRPTTFIQAVQSDVIQSKYTFDAPFGKKKSTYTDWFASGKPLKTFEDIMMKSVLPFYANTHTTTTSSAKRTTYCTKASRDTIARCLNVNTTPGHRHEAAVVFCGDGSTAAIAKVRSLFRLNDEAYWTQKASSVDIDTATSATSVKLEFAHARSHRVYPSQVSSLAPHGRPVVFLSIQEHHSNLLPWRESCADVVVIREDQYHRLDLAQLERELQHFNDRPLKIGTFSAGSNLTGVLNDSVAIAELLHKYNAFAFFDYAGVGAYTTVDMNPRPSDPCTNMSDSLAYKDGVFLSPHKLVGGPGSSGILAARVEVFSWASTHSCSSYKNEYVPTSPGGGTVDMVLEGRHKYINNILAREEAGTPNILATIRAGLVFRLQEIMNPSAILAKEYKLSSAIYQRLLKQPNVSILGTPELDRVAVFCAMIHIPRLSTPTRPLQIHYSLVSMIMNDFFGIEMRGGCMCAGPYASQLLKFDHAKEDKFWDLLMGNTSNNTSTGSSTNNIHKQDMVNQSLKPGFVRFSFPYFAREKDVKFVLQSFEWVAEYGYLLIPFYQVDALSGKWSLRPSVYRVVCEGISTKRLNGGSRDDYIPVAAACVDGLQRLLACQEQLPQVTVHKDTEAVGKSGLIYTLSQTHRSIANLLKTSTVTSGTRPEVSSAVNRSGDSLGSSASDPQPTVSYPSSSHYSVASDTFSKMDTHSHGQSTTHNPTNTKHSRGASSLSTHSPLWSAALEELSVGRLEDEKNAVESCELAKELRWFAMPSEVAEFYKNIRGGCVSDVLLGIRQ